MASHPLHHVDQMWQMQERGRSQRGGQEGPLPFVWWSIYPWCAQSLEMTDSHMLQDICDTDSNRFVYFFCVVVL